MIRPLSAETIAEILNPQSAIDRQTVDSLAGLLQAYGMKVKPAYVPTAEDVEFKKARFRMRAIEACRNSVGRTFRVEMEKGVFISGIIVDAVPAATRRRGRTVIQQFHVILECGAAKVRREVTVEALPR